MMTTTNTDESALDAASEKFLSAEREKKINKASGELADAQRRLSEAEQAHAEAAEAVVSNENTVTRTNMVEAENEVVIARAAVAIHARNLERAKARWSAELRAVALARVKAEREWAQCDGKRTEIKKKITESARLVILATRELEDLTLHEQSLAMTLRHAMQSFGQTVHAHHFMVPEVQAHASDAILVACRAEGFAPFTWKDNSPTRAIPDPRLAMLGAQAVIEPHEDFLERQRIINRNFQRYGRFGVTEGGE